MKDVTVIGSDLAGLTTAARLQALGFSTVILEPDSDPECCSQFYSHNGFTFDKIPADPIDFASGSVGSELLEAVGMRPVEVESLPASTAWLPDRTVTLSRNPSEWQAERRRVLGDSHAHQQFWNLIDEIATSARKDNRHGIHIPFGNVQDTCTILCSAGARRLYLARYLHWTLGNTLRRFQLTEDTALVGFLSLLVEKRSDCALGCTPLIDAVLKVSDLTSPRTQPSGGIHNFWRRFRDHYMEMGGELRTGGGIQRIDGTRGDFRINTEQGCIHARAVVSALPAPLTARIAPGGVQTAQQSCMKPERVASATTSVFLGVPEQYVAHNDCREHRLLASYVSHPEVHNQIHMSVSSPDDNVSAPSGFRSVIISSQFDTDGRERLSECDWQNQKAADGETLISLAQRVYPDLAHKAVLCRIETPEPQAQRPCKATEGTRPRLDSLAAPGQQSGHFHSAVPGFWISHETAPLAPGDAAYVLSSRIVARAVASDIGLLSRHPVPHFFRGLA